MVQQNEFIRNHYKHGHAKTRTVLIQKENKVTITPGIIAEIKMISSGVISTGGGN
jgi:hypothetical protein